MESLGIALNSVDQRFPEGDRQISARANKANSGEQKPSALAQLQSEQNSRMT
jgi:hypothetical protein